MTGNGRTVFCNATDEVAALRQWLDVGVERLFPDAESALALLLLLPRICPYRVFSLTVAEHGEIIVKAVSPRRIDCDRSHERIGLVAIPVREAA